MKAKFININNQLYKWQNPVTYSYRSISYIQRFIKGEQAELSMLDIFFYFWQLKDLYKELKINQLIFTFNIISSKTINKIVTEKGLDNIGEQISLKDETKLLIEEDQVKRKDQIFKYQGISLPKTMDITTWGFCIFDKNYKNAVIIKYSTIN